MELIERASHTHPNFRVDNEKVYFKLEEANRGTSYAASLKPFQRHKDGRGAYLAITTQNAGDNKWNAKIVNQDALLHNQKWKGNGSFTLEKHCNNHRHAYVQMQAASSHVAYQLPNAHTRVGYLLSSIETTDAELQAAMASVKQDKAPGGLREHFEDTVATLLPADPVSKKQVKGSKRGAEISSVNFENDEAAVASTTTMKSGKGASTGVDLRFHTSAEYDNLSHPQRRELKAWRLTPEGRASVKVSRAQRSGNNSNPLSKKRTGEQAKVIAAAVETALAKKAKAGQLESKESTQAEAFVVSVFNKLSGKTTTAPRTATANSVDSQSFLKSILKKAKNA